MAERRPVPAVACVAVVLLLVVAVGASLTFGSHAYPPGEVWAVLLGRARSGSADQAVLLGQRLPRTVLGAVVGAALGLAGSVMQALTRNPLADPGVLGVNAGAALAVVLTVALVGTVGVQAYVGPALLGAALAAAGVQLVAGTGASRAGPARLALVGVAVSAALMSLVQTVVLAHQDVANEFRLWAGGSLEGRGWSVLLVVAPLLAVGAVATVAVGPALDAIALGDDVARALGVQVGRTRGAALLAVTLLCGASTAAVGPVGFVGLAAPMLARALMGHHQRRVAVVSALLGAAWLLAADVAARVLVAPQELQVGAVAALVGAPVFVAVVRRRTVPAL